MLRFSLIPSGAFLRRETATARPIDSTAGRIKMTKTAMRQARAAGKVTEKRSVKIARAMSDAGKRADKAVLFTRAKYQNTLQELANK